MKTCTLLAFAFALVVSGCSCDGGNAPADGQVGDRSSAPADGPQSDRADLPMPSTTCERPPEPVVTGPTTTVGDGTSASCTAAALQAALDAGGTVRFACGAAHTIVLEDRLVVRRDVRIEGGGAITLDGQDNHRILDMDADNTASAGLTLVVRGLTMRRGNADVDGYEPKDGGAILGSYRGRVFVDGCTFDGNRAGVYGEEGGGAIGMKSEGSLVVLDSTFTNNRGGVGGGIRNLLSSITVVGSGFDGNDSRGGRDTGTQNGTPGGGYGSAIYVDGTSGGAATICGSVFRGGRAAGQGGALFLFTYASSGDRALVESSWFDDNVLETNARGDALGGAIRHGGGGPLTLRASAFVGNRAFAQGGAFWSGEDSPVEITNCTFFGNRAEGTSGDGLGGAIMHVGGEVRVLHSTFVGNYAGSEGGAIQGDARVVLRNSIVAGNTAGNPFGIKQNCGRPGNLGNDAPPALGGGGNLEWPAITERFNNPYCGSDAIVADPLVPDEPQSDGDELPVLLPGEGSPALEVATTDCPERDQRGTPRGDGACDLGAAERE